MILSFHSGTEKKKRSPRLWKVSDFVIEFNQNEIGVSQHSKKVEEVNLIRSIEGTPTDKKERKKEWMNQTDHTHEHFYGNKINFLSVNEVISFIIFHFTCTHKTDLLNMHSFQVYSNSFPMVVTIVRWILHPFHQLIWRWIELIQWMYSSIVIRSPSHIKGCAN